METIKEIIRELVVFLILSTVLEQCIQNTKYKKYYKLVVGMIVILIMLKPIQAVISTEYAITDYYLDLEFQSEIEGLEQSLGNIQEKISEKEMETYAVYLEDKVTKELKEAAFDINKTRITLFINSEEKIDIKEVLVYQQNVECESIETLQVQKNKEKYLKEYIAQRYGIETSVIKIMEDVSGRTE